MHTYDTHPYQTRESTERIDCKHRNLELAEYDRPTRLELLLNFSCEECGRTWDLELDLLEIEADLEVV